MTYTPTTWANDVSPYLNATNLNHAETGISDAHAMLGGGTSISGLVLADNTNIAVGTTNGTKIGTATTQKLSFFNSTPIVQPANTTDLRTALINLGLLATGGATPLDLNGGALTTGSHTFADNTNIAVGTTTGTKIGTATTQKLAFFNSTAIVQPANTTDLRAAMINLGLLASGGATPLDLNGGALTAASHTSSAINTPAAITRLTSTGYTSTASVTVASATTATLIGSGQGTLTIPANGLIAGRTIKVRAWGHFTTTGTPSTIIFLVKLGSTTVGNSNAGTALAPVLNVTVKPWYLECDITCRTTGASGTVFALGSVRMTTATALFNAATVAEVLISNTSTPTTATIDTTASQAIDLQLTDAGNGTSITCTNFETEILN